MHRAPSGHSRERDYGRDVYCILREMQEQLGYLQRAMVKVVKSVGANNERDETVRPGGGNGVNKGPLKVSNSGLGQQACGVSNGYKTGGLGQLTHVAS